MTLSITLDTTTKLGGLKEILAHAWTSLPAYWQSFIGLMPSLIVAVCIVYLFSWLGNNTAEAKQKRAQQ